MRYRRYDVIEGNDRVKNLRPILLVAGVLLSSQVCADVEVPLSAADQSAARAREALLLSVAESTELGALRMRIAESQLLVREFQASYTDPTLTERWKALRARALAEGTDDPLVQQAVINSRASDYPEADRAHAVAVLNAASGDNGYYGLSLLWMPGLRKDPAATQRLLHTMAGAQSFQSPFMALFRAFDTAATPLDWRVGMPAAMVGKIDPQLGQRVLGMAMISAIAMPALQPIYSVCEHAEGQARADCSAIARHWLADSETISDQSFATALWRRLCDGTDDCAEASAARRKQAWLQQKVMDQMAPMESEWSPALNRYFDRLNAVGEVAAMQEFVAAHGIPLDPPANWRSPWDTADHK